MIIDVKKFKILFGLFFPSVDLFTNRLWNISQSSKTIWAKHMHSICLIATPHIDRYVKINRHFPLFSDSYCFVHIVMLIIIQMHFVLLTTISLLFVWEGHFWIILKKGRGLSPQRPPPPPPPPFCTCLVFRYIREVVWVILVLWLLLVRIGNLGRPCAEDFGLFSTFSFC